jgi:aminoglycoside phosphotransferase (APT) family kinase protein
MTTEGARSDPVTLVRRDPTAVAAAITDWLEPRFLPGSRPRVTDLQLPSGAGFSNETYLLDVEHQAPGAVAGRTERFVVQAAPIGDALFQTYDLEKVFRLQRVLAERGVPVAPMRWYEPSPDVLGAPFYVMDRVAGQVPADQPSYHVEGFLHGLEPATRQQMWWSGLSAMAKVHAIDPAGIGVDLGSLDDPIADRLDHWTQFVAWASPDPLPMFDDAIDWLRAHRPHPKAAPSIVWGDAKISNVIFEDGEARALLDWELATVGPAEDDLMHWLLLDHFSARAAGGKRLEGLPERAETEDWYAGRLGRDLEAPGWWWIYAIVRLQAVVHRIMHQQRALGGLPPDTDIGAHNSISPLVRAVLDEAG